jgi:hypothetical protein
MTGNAPQWASPLLVAACFVLLWIAVTWLLSYTSGWVALARIYRADREATGIPVRLRAARMGHGAAGQFRNVLTLWVGDEGLQLRLQWLFRINSPDLFVPWTEIAATRGRQWFFDYIELKFLQAPEIPLRLYGEAAERVCAAAGERWPEKNSDSTLPLQT